MTKQITKASDLENLKLLDSIELNYHLNLPINSSGFLMKGSFGGSFQVDNNKYFVLSNFNNHPEAPWAKYLTSVLYKAHEDAIVCSAGVINDMYSSEEISSLVEIMNEHLNLFKKSKLEKLRHMDSKEKE